MLAIIKPTVTESNHRGTEQIRVLLPILNGKEPYMDIDVGWATNRTHVVVNHLFINFLNKNISSSEKPPSRYNDTKYIMTATEISRIKFMLPN